MSYRQATCHPAPCLFFILPLLVAYEYGVLSIGDGQSALRNGADVLLRTALAALGLKGGLVAPLVLFFILFIWAFRRRNDPPDDAAAICMGMFLESVAIGLVLWMLSRHFGAIVDYFGVRLALAGGEDVPIAIGGTAAITFLGAGIYEEVLFRLVLFTGLSKGLRLALMPRGLAEVGAALAAAGAFAVVHHLGPSGEPVNGYVFVFRVLAGLYFTAVYQFRGLGIAVGAHACYDVLVGVAM